MPFSLFIIFITVAFPLIILGFIFEDRLIEIEDRIIANIRHSRAEKRRGRNVRVVKKGAPDNGNRPCGGSACRGYVA